MRNLLFSILGLFVFCPTFSQLSLGVETGLYQHVAGGGPYIGLGGKFKNFRFGAQLLTQINRFTPYFVEPYSGFRRADELNQVFGAGISLGYEFKLSSAQRIRPILFYRSTYFNTGYHTKYFIECYVGNEHLYQNMLRYSKSFSTTQSIMAGITVDIAKNLKLDFLAGSGLYLYKDYSAWATTPSGETVRGVNQYRPDLNLNLSISYLFMVN